MGNCLVTKLKESVANDNLQRLNCLMLHVFIDGNTNVDRRRFSIQTPSLPITVTCPQGNYLSKNSNFSSPSNVISYNVSDNAREFYLLEGEYDIIIDNKYDITILANAASVEANGVINMDLSVLTYCNNLTDLTLPYTNKVFGNLNTLPTKIQNVNFTSNFSLKSNIEGSIESLSQCPLNSLRLSWSTNVIGELSTLCSQMASWRTSGTVTIDIRNTKATYNGSVPTSILTVYFGTSMEGHSPTTAETTQGWCVR